MNIQKLLSSTGVRTAREAIHRQDRETVLEQLRLVAIPAPTDGEGERAAYLLARFREIGLEEPYVDDAGNVLGSLPMDSPLNDETSGPVIVAAHLDTVFPPGTPIQIRREGERFIAPGITDNSRGLAAMLRVAVVLHQAGIRTRRPIVFAATVGEEGLGDLRGVKHLFRADSPHRSASAFIALDGAGIDRIVHRAIGSIRYRVTVSGSGGHSWADRGTPNPIHALGLAISRLARLEPPASAAFAVGVGRIGGGTSVNSIPAEAWLELDLRSDEPPALAALDAAANRILRETIEEESTSSGEGPRLEVRIDAIGVRPSGETGADSALVRVAVEVTKLLGGSPDLAGSSTDANVPISLGIPAIAIGAGGQGGKTHTTEEWFENHNGAIGVERALILLLIMAGVAEIGQDPAAATVTTE